MQAIEFYINTEYVELCNLLKLVGIADSGGRGKMMVAEGLVHVDGAVDLRKTAKIRVGQTVECEGQIIRILLDENAETMPLKIKPPKTSKTSPFDLKSANKSYTSKKSLQKNSAKKTTSKTSSTKRPATNRANKAK